MRSSLISSLLGCVKPKSKASFSSLPLEVRKHFYTFYTYYFIYYYYYLLLSEDSQDYKLELKDVDMLAFELNKESLVVLFKTLN